MGKRNFNKLTDQEFERVIENRGLGLQNRESAAQIGISESSVFNLLKGFDYIRKDDWNGVAHQLNRTAITIDFIEWAGTKLGKEIPQSVYDILAVRKDESETQQRPDSPEKENEGLWMLKILEILQKMAETEDKIAARLSVIEKQVLPEMVKDITSNANANGDMLNNTMLDIRSNTRKRGT